MNINSINQHVRDSHIKFIEKTHKYIVDGKSDYISATTLIHKYFPKFDAFKVINKMRVSGNKELEKGGKYYEMTDKQILDFWKSNGEKSSEKGTNIHSEIEHFYNENIFPKNQSKEFIHFLEFNESIKNKLTPYRTEWSIFSDNPKIAGQLDILFKINNTNNFALYDWKCIKALNYSNTYEKGLEIFDHLDHCNYNHYSIQLGIYKKILKDYYDINITEMKLLILNEESYILIDINNLVKEVNNLFDTCVVST